MKGLHLRTLYTLHKPTRTPMRLLASLEQLLAEHRVTAKEIKNLESDLQQLVYENYSKFISATDTIRAMKTKVDGQLPELHHLKTTMGGLGWRTQTHMHTHAHKHFQPSCGHFSRQPFVVYCFSGYCYSCCCCCCCYSLAAPHIWLCLQIRPSCLLQLH